MNLTEAQKAYIRQYGAVARRIEVHEITFRHIELEEESERIVQLKKLFEAFLAEPTKENFLRMWDNRYIYSAKMQGSALQILKKRNIKQIKDVLVELDNTNDYNEAWEGRFGARNALREFWGKIKNRPIQNGCANEILELFGYGSLPGHKSFLTAYSDFSKEYSSALGKEKATHFSKDLEIDKLFNVTQKIQEKDLAGADQDLIKLFELRQKLESAPTSQVGYWAIAAGPNGQFEKDFVDNSYIAIGWDEVGDLRGKTKEEIRLKLRKTRGETQSSLRNNALACYDFVNVMKTSDRLFLKKGTGQILAIGNVVSDYIFDESRSSFKHIRKVRWEKVRTLERREGDRIAYKTLTDLTPYKDYCAEIESLYSGSTGNEWIFQANPASYPEVFDDLKSNRGDQWSANQGYRKMLVGDRVYFYICGEKAGIYAIGKIISEPKVRSADDPDIRFGNRSVEVTVEKYLQKPILKESLEANSILKSLGVFTFRNASNFLMKPNEVSELQKLLPTQIVMPKNLIIYGPPGTGKTYTLKRDYFPKYSEKSANKSREEHLRDLVKDYSWWEIFAAVLYQVGSASVPEIKTHELVVAKTAISNNRNIGTTIWGHMQYHTKQDCPNVNFANRAEPKIFWKDEKSKWSVDKAMVEEQAPEILAMLQKSKNWNVFETKEEKRYKFVTFHQSYGYEEFVEGIRPIVDEDGQVRYEVCPGVFKILAEEASKHPEKDYALFIDEINRGNISKIFGELITLIEEDKRIGAENEIRITLPYSKEDFGVPQNLYIVGTMNTADRSIALVDIALRRRFTFKLLDPNYELPELKHVDVLKKLNDKIVEKIGPEYKIGHSYFMGPEADNLCELINAKIIPLLTEYFYDDKDSLKEVLSAAGIPFEESSGRMSCNLR
jgi:predicted Mrr-cat superfamily restriction endonuclease/DNA polymerase III delta prime subunit